jgi:hypothetical protein
MVANQTISSGSFMVNVSNAMTKMNKTSSSRKANKMEIIVEE